MSLLKEVTGSGNELTIICQNSPRPTSGTCKWDHIWDRIKWLMKIKVCQGNKGEEYGWGVAIVYSMGLMSVCISACKSGKWLVYLENYTLIPPFSLHFISVLIILPGCFWLRLLQGLLGRSAAFLVADPLLCVLGLWFSLLGFISPRQCDHFLSCRSLLILLIP